MLASRLGSWRSGLVPAHGWRSVGIAALATAWIGESGVARGQCPEWSPYFANPGPHGTVSAMVEHDDGSGPALYLGGNFTSVTGLSVPVDHVVRWDGTDWSAVGSGLGGWVFALAVFDDGTGPKLYAGGEFTGTGGVSASNVARWDGLGWSALGSGLDDIVMSLAVFDDGSGPALYAGGEFASAGGLAAYSIAKWDGADWHPLGSGMSGTGATIRVNDLTVWDDGSGPALYAAGRFTVAGGIAASRIAKWDGSTWTPLGAGLGQEAWAVAVHSDPSGSALYAGGLFKQAGGTPAAYIARWDGASWSALGAGMAGTAFSEGTVVTLLSHGGALYAGGWFHSAGGLPASRIARWDGAVWSALGEGISGSSVQALASHDDGSGAGPALYVGGGFGSAGAVSASGLARWNGVWSAVGPGGNEVSERIHDFAVHDDGNGPALFATGSFLKAGGIQANLIARWDGTIWSPLGSGLGLGTAIFEDGLALTEWDDGTGLVLVAGGLFSQAGGYPASNIARWNGVDWRPLGSGFSGAPGGGQVNDLAVWDDGSGPALHAAGDFTVASGISARRIAKWDGSSWVPLGTGLDGEAMALAVHGDAKRVGPLCRRRVPEGGRRACGAHREMGRHELVGARCGARRGRGSAPEPRRRAVRGWLVHDGRRRVREPHRALGWHGVVGARCGAQRDDPVALASYDDGAGQGTVLYAGGLFSLAGGCRRATSRAGTERVGLLSGADSTMRSLQWPISRTEPDGLRSTSVARSRRRASKARPTSRASRTNAPARERPTARRARRRAAAAR